MSISPQMLEEFLPVVRYWARHYTHGKHPVLDVEDLVVVGMMGLMDAAKRFHPRHHTQFKTYAEFRIRGEILDELRRQDWMSRGERRKQKQFRQAVGALEQELGHHPTETELAKVLSFQRADIARFEQYDAKDTHKPYTEGELGCEDAGMVQVIERDALENMLAQLPPTIGKVLRMRYFEDASLAEISRAVGLSQGRVSQLHGEGLAFLRDEMKAA
jgi:RNA polymerase sigma factor for flagellar operon FliA